MRDEGLAVTFVIPAGVAWLLSPGLLPYFDVLAVEDGDVTADRIWLDLGFEQLGRFLAESAD